MIKKVKIETATDLKHFMHLAWNCPTDVGVHTDDGKIADAKSILGLMALDYTKPVMVVTEDKNFFNLIKPLMIEEL